MAQKIYLVRHGQTDWNVKRKTQGHTDILLNDTGRLQAEKAAQTLMPYRFNRIYSSDLSRAKETAEIINRHFCLPLHCDKRLREFDYGDLEGVYSDTITDETWHIYNFQPEELHAESKLDIYNRVCDFLDSISNEGDVLIVTHGGILRLILHCVKSKNVFNQNDFFFSFQSGKIPNAAIYVWDKETNTIQLLSESDN